MEKYYTTDLKYLIPLVGVLIGWLLTTLSGFFKGVSEKQKIIAKALTQLHFLYIEQLKLLTYFEYLKRKYKVGPLYERRRLEAMKRYVLNHDNLKTSLDIVSDISSIYPFLAMDLKGLIENYAFSQKIELSSTSNKNNRIYISLLSMFEVAFELDNDKLKKIIFRLSFGYSIISWIRLKRKYYLLNKQYSSKENPNFFEMFEEEITKDNIVPTQKEEL